MNPTVSVIIPNYNHARFLEERIQSVLNQTYQDFELILLDDCSPDDGASRAIIERYRCNPHVSHIEYNEVNSGSAFKQWHKGFELARGEYIWIAESDDSCDRKLLATLVGQLEEYQAVMAFCQSVAYDENGRRTPFVWQNLPEDDFVKDGRAFIKEHLMQKNNVANASSVVFRRDALPVGDNQYMQMKADGDWLFWMLIAEQGAVCYTHETLNFFRLHATNTTKANNRQGIADKEEFVLFEHLVKRNLISKGRSIYVRTKKVFCLMQHPYDEQTQRVIMKIWDRHHIYRFLANVYQLKKIIKLWKRFI